VNPDRRAFIILGVKAALVGTAVIILGQRSASLALPSTTEWTLRQWLNRHDPAWQPWDCVGFEGQQGIWSIPLLRIDQGRCHITFNGRLLLGQGVNVDTIIMPAELPLIGPLRISRA